MPILRNIPDVNGAAGMTLSFQGIPAPASPHDMRAVMTLCCARLPGKMLAVMPGSAKEQKESPHGANETDDRAG
ncbi:hypothetical protein AA0616_1148 [Komagataeibacter nataicola NRIC 0616]|nr:hypothetical protein AA0616_1148 [Komagataeibacter nataicola NRIC 0616]